MELLGNTRVIGTVSIARMSPKASLLRHVRAILSPEGKPFSLTPDPDYLYLASVTPCADDAHILVRGLRLRSDTGEVGFGKHCRASFLQRIDRRSRLHSLPTPTRMGSLLPGSWIIDWNRTTLPE